MTDWKTKLAAAWAWLRAYWLPANITTDLDGVLGDKSVVVQIPGVTLVLCRLWRPSLAFWWLPARAGRPPTAFATVGAALFKVTLPVPMAAVPWLRRRGWLASTWAIERSTFELPAFETGDGPGDPAGAWLEVIVRTQLTEKEAGRAHHDRAAAKLLPVRGPGVPAEPGAEPDRRPERGWQVERDEGGVWRSYERLRPQRGAEGQ